jgi:hypothetical protein
VIIDSFQSSAAHGFVVEGAAASLGSTGTVFRYSQHDTSQGRATMPHVDAIATLQVGISAEALPAEQARQQLQSFISDAAAGNLRLATSVLKSVEKEGFQNSVVNLSQGLDALTLLHLVKHPLGPKSKLSAGQQEVYRSNLDSAVAAPLGSTEQQRDQRLLQEIKSALASLPAVEQAVEDWRAQVRSFETDHNSVVLAAGNSGQALKGLQQAGFEIDGSEDRNLLSVPEVTTVGAIKTGPQGQLSLAGASSFGPEVDFIADGDHAGRFGTSFASPKVANAMRGAHLANPTFTSDQVEDWVRSELSEQVQIGHHPVAILDTHKASRLLSILNS